MSWQAYITQNLIDTKKIVKAAIHGVDGSTWGTSNGFAIAPQELQALTAGFNDASSLRANGLRLGGTKYIVIRADDRSIYGKAGNTGVVCVKMKQAVLVGVYDDKTQPGDATNLVEKLADSMIAMNY